MRYRDLTGQRFGIISLERAQVSNMGITELLTIIFVVCKIAGFIDWSWLVVFLPEIIAIAIYIIIFLVSALGIGKVNKHMKKHFDDDFFNFQKGKVNNMIDQEKWGNASDEVKMQAIETIKAVMNENTVTKADNQIITDYLLGKVKGE